jgi:hypothetical protein
MKSRRYAFPQGSLPAIADVTCRSDSTGPPAQAIPEQGQMADIVALFHEHAAKAILEFVNASQLGVGGVLGVAAEVVNSRSPFLERKHVPKMKPAVGAADAIAMLGTGFQAKKGCRLIEHRAPALGVQKMRVHHQRAIVRHSLAHMHMRPVRRELGQIDVTAAFGVRGRIEEGAETLNVRLDFEPDIFAGTTADFVARRLGEGRQNRILRTREINQQGEFRAAAKSEYRGLMLAMQILSEAQCVSGIRFARKPFVMHGHQRQQPARDLYMQHECGVSSYYAHRPFQPFTLWQKGAHS